MIGTTFSGAVAKGTTLAQAPDDEGECNTSTVTDGAEDTRCWLLVN